MDRPCRPVLGKRVMMATWGLPVFYVISWSGSFCACCDMSVIGSFSDITITSDWLGNGSLAITQDYLAPLVFLGLMMSCILRFNSRHFSIRWPSWSEWYVQRRSLWKFGGSGSAGMGVKCPVDRKCWYISIIEMVSGVESVVPFLDCGRFWWNNPWGAWFRKYWGWGYE